MPCAPGLGHDGGMRAVLFDLQGTLVVPGSIDRWIEDAKRACGVPVSDQARLVDVLTRVWTLAGVRYPDRSWDLDPALHRHVFGEVLGDEAGCPRSLTGALYETMIEQWRATPGAVDLLSRLRRRGLRIALVSNTALDVRSGLQRVGLLELVDVVITSSDVGRAKPDPAIFALAAERLNVPVAGCVHVGDSAVHDGGAADAGIPVVVVPLRDGVPRLDLVAPLLGVDLGAEEPEVWPMPPSVGTGLTLELSRAKVRVGRIDRARAWMAMLNERLDECEQTLSVERSAFEAWFLDEQGDDSWIWHVGLAGEGGALFDESSALDADHLAFAREVLGSPWDELEPMFLLVPPHIRVAIDCWARTGHP